VVDLAQYREAVGLEMFLPFLQLLHAVD
jgi:hypothetical protein